MPQLGAWQARARRRAVGVSGPAVPLRLVTLDGYDGTHWTAPPTMRRSAPPTRADAARWPAAAASLRSPPPDRAGRQLAAHSRLPAALSDDRAVVDNDTGTLPGDAEGIDPALDLGAPTRRQLRRPDRLTAASPTRPDYPTATVPPAPPRPRYLRAAAPAEGLSEVRRPDHPRARRPTSGRRPSSSGRRAPRSSRRRPSPARRSGGSSSSCSARRDARALGSARPSSSRPRSRCSPATTACRPGSWSASGPATAGDGN